MARYRYQMYRDGFPLLMHRSNDLDELVKRAERLGALFDEEYEIRNIQGIVVWKKEDKE